MNYFLLIFAGLMLYGIRLMGSPKTAVRGNRLGAFAMLAAVVISLINQGILDIFTLWLGIIIGALIGYFLANRIMMTQMPQLVAILNGLGGGASALVGLLLVYQGFDGNMFAWFTTGLTVIVGGLTLSGSAVAAGKLHGLLKQKPVQLKKHGIYVLAILAIMLLELWRFTILISPAILSSIILLLFAFLFGILLTIRVGGADMPIMISLLNSFSGLAGSIAGLALGAPLLVAVGAIVGASGFILTDIMCKAMNRKLLPILTGQTTTARPGGARVTSSPGETGNKLVKETAWQDALATAQNVVIVPGYGMALAQGQNQVKKLIDTLQGQGKEVKVGIHPVAGRMPGHMNVLLAEVDVPYEQLYELEDINSTLPETDLVIVVGANDVVNPAALDDADTPIYGMPILQVDQAKFVLVCNYDTAPGYAGVDNRLYHMDHVALLLGDAKDSLERILNQLSGEVEVAEEKLNHDEKHLLPIKLLTDAKQVVIVPGYGMALAAAQWGVKELVDQLQANGTEVILAIHPVAGRMPGHMNVLLAEVDIPYELMYELDKANDLLPQVDVALVVGANDVVNPAAHTAADTPIYGMPVLDVEKAKHVIVCNLDRSPGYAGVDNTLYDQENCLFIPGDASQTIGELVSGLHAQK